MKLKCVFKEKSCNLLQINKYRFEIPPIIPSFCSLFSKMKNIKVTYESNDSNNVSNLKESLQGKYTLNHGKIAKIKNR